MQIIGHFKPSLCAPYAGFGVHNPLQPPILVLLPRSFAAAGLTSRKDSLTLWVYIRTVVLLLRETPVAGYPFADYPPGHARRASDHDY